jgi:hypothetical protein
MLFVIDQIMIRWNMVIEVRKGLKILEEIDCILLV